MNSEESTAAHVLHMGTIKKIKSLTLVTTKYLCVGPCPLYEVLQHICYRLLNKRFHSITVKCTLRWLLLVVVVANKSYDISVV